MPKCSHLACSHLRTNLSRFDQTDQRAPPRCTTGRLLAAAQRRTLQRTRLKHSARCSAPEWHSASYAGVALRSTTGTACTTCERTAGAATHECIDECSESRAQPPRDGARRGTGGRCVLEGFAAATGAVSRLVVTTALGAATVKANIVTPDQINGLAKVVYNFFLPCFLFTTLIRTVATYGLSPELLLLMPFAACAQIAIAFLVSRFLLVPLVGVKPRSAAARELTLSGSFGNPGSFHYSSSTPCSPARATRRCCRGSWHSRRFI